MSDERDIPARREINRAFSLLRFATQPHVRAATLFREEERKVRRLAEESEQREAIEEGWKNYSGRSYRDP